MLFLAGFLSESSFFSESRLCTWPLFSHFCKKSGSVGRPTNHLNSFVGSILWETIVWIYNLTVMMVSQIYRELSLQVELVNNCSIPSMHAERKITVCSHKQSFIPYASLSPYWRTNRITDRETNTLDARTLENFFSSCAVLSVFWFLVGNRFWCYTLIYVSRVQYSCGVVLVFWFWWEILFGITYLLSVQYTCAVVSDFWLWWELVLWWEIVLKICR